MHFTEDSISCKDGLEAMNTFGYWKFITPSVLDHWFLIEGCKHSRFWTYSVLFLCVETHLRKSMLFFWEFFYRWVFSLVFRNMPLFFFQSDHSVSWWVLSLGLICLELWILDYYMSQTREILSSYYFALTVILFPFFLDFWNIPL